MLQAVAITYSFLAGLATIAGVAIILARGEAALRYSHYMNSFAAGAILGVAFLDLIPESIVARNDALIVVFMGFLAFYILETAIVFHSGAEVHYEDRQAHAKSARGMVAFVGLFFHSLVDGVIISVGFQADLKLGLLTAIGVILHEFPEGVTTTSILMSTVGRSMALKMALAVALATPLGTLLCSLFIGGLSQGTLGFLLAIAGGAFLYVGGSDLIPETHGPKGWQNAAFLAAGAIAVYLAGHLH